MCALAHRGFGAAFMKVERLVLLTVVGALSAALVLSEIARLNQNKQLSERLEAAETNADAALNAVIEPAMLQKTDKSVYMIVSEKTYHGTAFVIDRERGLLVTAAHVIEQLPLEEPNTTISVVNRYSKKPAAMLTSRMHAGYGAFREVAEAYQPIDPKSPIVNPRIVPLHDFSNDAAILIVDPIDPETGENILGPDLPIATRETLLSLKAGDPIAVVGFPSDNIVVNTAKSAASRTERGVIASMISPIDLVEESGDPVRDNLIVHRMATAGGNSGGPILDRDGRVIGIHSHGYDSTQSNGDGLAQRADVIHDLLNVFQEEESVARIYKPDWEKRLSRWVKAREALPYTLYYRHAKRMRNGAAYMEKTFQDIDFNAEKKFRAQINDLEFMDAQRSFSLPAPDLIKPKPKSETASPPRRTSSRTTIKAAPTPTFEFKRSGEYSVMAFRRNPNRHYVVFAFDYSVNWSQHGFCRVDAYHRKLGEDTFTPSMPTTFPTIRYRPDVNEDDPKSKAIQQHQVVFRRPNCGNATSPFFAGILSWEEPQQEEQSAATVVAAAFDLQSQRIRVQETAGKIANFTQCRLGANDDMCLTPVSAHYAPVRETP